ncbi:DUF4007 family protein [Anoxybacteroides amylolyticum]|uniref:DUF4007 domain-containing protein n=1 Tax=Anoxybacteroides amylolyticum TaxID=294699 RepID=A0A160F5Y1_9BACL|nr:DUF4007 family protein [Anoxybacillus amylolyticus]ANB61472.1 hypothetical protein GFC30_2280 [Anoxybacillus amylolyticus]
MAYGQHQSFYLRDRWLSKGIKNLMEDERFFYNKDSFEIIGLGKNMLQSLRFWLIATRIVQEKFNGEQKKVHHVTPLGEIIYRFDRFVRFSDTASILHYELTKEREPATAWYWFFNILRQQSLLKEELLQLFVEWVSREEKREISTKSLKRDIECLIKLYTAGQTTFDPEEVIQSPIYKISLLEEKNGMVRKRDGRIENIGVAALMYSLLDYRERKGVETIAVDEIVTEEGLWGRIFNMNRATVVNALEILTNHPVYKISFTRTNNLDTVKLPSISAIDYLRYEYERKVETLV